MSSPKIQKLLDRLGTLVLVIVAGLAFFQWFQQSQSGPKENTQAKPFTLPVANRPGNMATLASYSGSPLVIEVVAAWCSACKSMAPKMAALSRKQRTVDVKFLSVAIDSSVDEASTLRNAWQIPFDVAVGDSSFQRAYEISALPTLIVVDAQGVIRHVTTGVTSEYRLNSWLENVGAHLQ